MTMMSRTVCGSSSTSRHTSHRSSPTSSRTPQTQSAQSDDMEDEGVART